MTRAWNQLAAASAAFAALSSVSPALPNAAAAASETAAVEIATRRGAVVGAGNRDTAAMVYPGVSRRRRRPVELAARATSSGAEGQRRILQVTAAGDPTAQIDVGDINPANVVGPQDADAVTSGGDNNSTETATGESNASLTTEDTGIDDGGDGSSGLEKFIGENPDGDVGNSTWDEGGVGDAPIDPFPAELNNSQVVQDPNGTLQETVPVNVPEMNNNGDTARDGTAAETPEDPSPAAATVRPWGPGCPSRADTSFDDSNGSYGNVFHARTPRPASNNDFSDAAGAPQADVWVTGLDFYTDLKKEMNYEVYTMQGVYYADYTGDGLPLGDFSQWTMIANGTAMGRGRGVGTPIPDDEFTPVKIPAGGRARSFYVTLTTPDIRYTSGEGLNLLAPDPDGGGVPADLAYAGGGDLFVYEGVGVLTYPFSKGTYQYSTPRLFLGAVRYEVEGTCAPTAAPTRVSDPPTPRPSPQPTTLAPTTPPSPPPTPSPTDAVELLTTRVLYTFFVTHSSAIDEAAFLLEIESAAQSAVAALTEEEGNELFDRTVDDGMVLAGAEAYRATEKNEPECNPADPVAETCSTVAVTITVEHRPTATRDDARRALFLHGPDVALSLGHPAVYTGIEALTSSIIISLDGLSEDAMDGDGATRFRRWLQNNGGLDFGDAAGGGSSATSPSDGSTQTEGGSTDGSDYTDMTYTNPVAAGAEGLMGNSEIETVETVLKKFLQERLQALGVDVTTSKVTGQQWVPAAEDGEGGDGAYEDGGDYSVEEGDGIIIPDGGDVEDSYGSEGGGEGQGGLFFENDPTTAAGSKRTEGTAADDGDGASRRLRRQPQQQGASSQQRRRRVSNQKRRLPKSSNMLAVTTVVTGEYRPPPRRDMDELVEDSIDAEPDEFVRKLKINSKSDFFDDTSGVKTRQADGGTKDRGTDSPTAAPQEEVVAAPKSTGGGDDDQTKLIAIVAAVVGVVVLCVAAGFVYVRFYRKSKFSEEEMDISDLMAKQATQSSMDKSGFAQEGYGEPMGKMPPEEAFHNSMNSYGPYDGGGKPPPQESAAGGYPNCEASLGSVPTVQMSNRRGDSHPNCEASLGSVPTVQMSNRRGDSRQHGNNLDGVDEYGEEEGDDYQEDFDEHGGGGGGGFSAPPTQRQSSQGSYQLQARRASDPEHDFRQDGGGGGGQGTGSDPYDQRMHQSHRSYGGEDTLHYRHLDDPTQL